MRTHVRAATATLMATWRWNGTGTTEHKKNEWKKALVEEHSKAECTQLVELCKKKREKKSIYRKVRSELRFLVQGWMILNS